MVSRELVAACLWLIPAAPLAACLLTAALGPRLLRGQSHWPCVLGLLVSFGCSVPVLLAMPDHQMVETVYPWIKVGGLNVDVALRADSLTAMMLGMVTFVSLLVAVYSVGYMRGDPGYPRFFAEIALFVFAMTMLVLSTNFLVLYVFWEAVGLCSYLLIGYWYPRPSAAAAAQKAFLVNRVGDFGFAVGLFLIWVTFGSLDYDAVLGAARAAPTAAARVGGRLALLGWEVEPAWVVTAICLLLFTGAVGKSAQFPLHVWLPDAMEGPTPVSALIHAATMVTAGVYLVARCTALFVHAPAAQLVVAALGGFTALLAALIALTQYDLKRVLAYSTVSQLGYMFLGLGCAAAFDRAGSHAGLITAAVIAALFHLFTHAFFKALLFLGSGSVMHAMGDVIDMRRFGGLRRVLPWTHLTFLIGALALAGFPLLSGFWSKDEILTLAYHATHGDRYAPAFTVLVAGALVTTFLTAFYTFRAYFLTFAGAERYPPEAGDHPHEAPAVMLGPLAVLALGALGVGALVGPTHLFGDYLEQTPHLPAAPAGHAFDWVMMAASAGLALLGIGLAYAGCGRRAAAPARPAAAHRWWYQLSANKFYLDELYDALLVRPIRGFAALFRWLDQNIVDGLVDLVGHVPAAFGHLFRPVQNGLVQFYALATLLGLTVFVVALVYRLSG